MPSIVDMGIASAFQPTPNVINDPSILMSALALRERKRQNKADNEYRQQVFDRGVAESDRSFNEGVRQFDTRTSQVDRNYNRGVVEFDRAAGQRDRALDMEKSRYERLESNDTRAQAQEAAAQGMFADLAEEMGIFRKQGPDGAEYSLPKAREMFMGMSPDDQQRAIAMHAQERTNQQQMAAVAKLATLTQNAVTSQAMTPEEAEVINGAAAADPANAGRVYGEVLQSVQEKAKQALAEQQRQEQIVGVQQTLQSLQASGVIRPEIAAAHLSRLMIDPDAKPSQIIKDAIGEAEQMEVDRELGATVRAAQTRVEQLTDRIDQARQVASLIPATRKDQRMAAVAELEAMMADLAREQQTLERVTGRAQTGFGRIMPGEPGFSEAHASLGLTSQHASPGGPSASKPSEDDLEAAYQQAVSELQREGKKKPRDADIKARMSQILGG